MVPNKPDREVIKEHTIAGMNAAKKAIFAHPLEKFRACLPPEALKTAGGDAGVVDGVLGVAMAQVILD